MGTEISTQTQSRGLSLRTMDDAMAFGQMVADSDFAPKDFRGKAASCVLAIQAGAEIGLSPMQALQSIAVVNGRPSVYGDAALAVCKASHLCEYVTEFVEGEGDQMIAFCQAKRRGYPKATVVQFSVADAKKAGLWGKGGPWSSYPKRMLQMRARGFAIRDAFPDVLKGLVTAEEAQDYEHNAQSEHQVSDGLPSPVASAQTPAKAAPAAQGTAPAEAKEEKPLFHRIADHIAGATSVRSLGAIGNRIDELLSDGQLTNDQHHDLTGELKKRHDLIEPEVLSSGVA